MASRERYSLKKTCDECGKEISLFGGSWEIDGRNLCSQCERIIREKNSSNNQEVSIDIVCAECGQKIGIFGGSWKIDGKNVCSKCEKKLRLENEPEIKEELRDDRRSSTDYINKESTKEIPSNINVNIDNRENTNLSKYCIECGNAISNIAKFCENCGTKVGLDKEIVKKVQTEEIPDSSSPALLDLKAAYSILEEVNEILDNTQKIQKPLIREITSKLRDIEKFVENAKKQNSNVYLLNPTDNEKISPEIVHSQASFIAGFIGIGFVFDHLKDDKSINIFETPFFGEISIKYGKVGKNLKQYIFRTAQKNFVESNNFDATDIAQFYIAFSMDMQIQGINRIGDYILDIDGNKIYLNPLSTKKAKKAVYDTYQKVIDLYPNSKWAVEAHKRQSEIRL